MFTCPQSSYAHYMAGVARGKKNLYKDFKDYYEHDSYVFNYTSYALHLQKWYDTFDSSQIMVIDQAEFGTTPLVVMRRMEKHLNIPYMFTENNFPRLNKDSNYFCNRDFNNKTTCLKPEKKEREHEEYSSKSDQKKVHDYFIPFNEALKTLTGQDFQWI